MLQTLIDVEMASKILLGALSKKEEMNPLEYCLLASGASLKHLSPKSEEFLTIKNYALNTTVEV